MLSKIFLGVGIFAAVFAVLIFSGKIPGIGNSADAPQGEVILWGTFPETQMNPIIQNFNPQAKTYRVTYVEVPEENFDRTLLEALANGKGPDLVLAPYQILLAEASRIAPFPVTSLDEQKFKNSYVDGAPEVFWTPVGALALPISVEPMMLFYNRTILSKHGIINPPKFWDEVAYDVTKITTVGPRGQLLESGIALGAPNTPYAKDIIMAIVSQLGQSPVLKQYDSVGKVIMTVTANDPVTEGGDVFPLSATTRFFAQFADPNQKTYTWNQFIGSAEDQFVAEKLAMYIGYYGELEVLRARNPRARFEVAELPQTREYSNRSTGMRMYGLAMMNSTRNPAAARAVQVNFATGDVPALLSSIVRGVPPFRTYAATPGINTALAGSMNIAHGWQDRFSNESTQYVAVMISDILNNRMSVTDAANIFVSRMQDLYTPIK